MRKSAFSICQNKGIVKQCGKCNIESTIPLLSKSKISSLEPSSVAAQPGLCRTWSDTKDRFSHNTAQIQVNTKKHKPEDQWSCKRSPDILA